MPAAVKNLPPQGTFTGGTITQNAHFNALEIGENQTLTIDGDVTLYVSGKVNFANSSGLVVKNTPGSSLRLFFDGDFKAVNSNTINNQTRDPRRMQIIGQGDGRTVHLINSVDLYGTIYAPDAKVIFGNSNNIYGAVVAREAKFGNSIQFHYDASLRQNNFSGGNSFKIIRWKED